VVVWEVELLDPGLSFEVPLRVFKIDAAHMLLQTSQSPLLSK
jgi:hypothetical protein